LASSIKWIGIEKYERKLMSLAQARTKFHKEYLDVIGDLTLKMIRQAAPKKTGAYANSWSIVRRSEKFIIIDTSDPDLFNYLENGVPYETPGRFVAALGKRLITTEKDIGMFPVLPKRPHIIFVQRQLDKVMKGVMRSQMKKHNKLFNHIQGSGIPRNSNLTKTVGLTGTKVSSLRGRGKISMVRARTGRKQFKRRLGRRRRTGQWIKRATAD